jgi:hypothetical protein
LISAFALGKRPISADIVREVCEDFDLKQVAAIGSFGASTGEVPAGDGRHQLDVIRQTPAGDKKASGTRDMFAGLVRPRRWYSVF